MSQTVHQRLDTELRGLGRMRRHLLAKIAALLLAMKRERSFLALGYGSLGDYAQARLDCSVRKARDLVELAERCEELPRVREAFESGEIHWTKLRTIARVAKAENEGAWLERAASMSSRALERAVAEASGEPAPKIKVVLELTDEQYADLEDAVRALRRERRTDPGPVSREAALLELVRRGAGGTAESPRPRFQTIICRCERCEAAVRETRLGPVPVEPATDGCARCDSELVDGRRPGRVGNLGPVGACDVRALKGPHQTIPPAVRRFVLARDRGRCVVPSCANRDYLDVHHVVPRKEGGDHDPAKLGALCEPHHTAVHEGTIRVEGCAPSFRFFTEDGMEIGADAHVRSEGGDGSLSETARCVLEALGEEPRQLDDVIEETGLGASQVFAAATELELAGLARRRSSMLVLSAA